MSAQVVLSISFRVKVQRQSLSFHSIRTLNLNVFIKMSRLMRSGITIDQDELIKMSTITWCGIRSKKLLPISHNNQSSLIELMQVSLFSEKDFSPNNDSSSSTSQSSNNVTLVISTVLFSQIQKTTRITNQSKQGLYVQYSVFNSVYPLLSVPDNIFLTQHKHALLCRWFIGTHKTNRLPNNS